MNTGLAAGNDDERLLQIDRSMKSVEYIQKIRRGHIGLAVTQAIASGEAAVIDCHIGCDETITPMVAPGKPITEFVLHEHEHSDQQK